MTCVVWAVVSSIDRLRGAVSPSRHRIPCPPGIRPNLPYSGAPNRRFAASGDSTGLGTETAIAKLLGSRPPVRKLRTLCRQNDAAIGSASGSSKIRMTTLQELPPGCQTDAQAQGPPRNAFLFGRTPIRLTPAES